MQVIPVFVSSTYKDLVNERDAVIRRLASMDEVKPVNMENFGVRADSPRESSLKLVDDCQIYVGIFGDRFGTGITRDEYRRAIERNLPCLLFLIGEDSEDTGPDMRAFRAELRKNHLPQICTRANLAEEVATGVHNQIVRGVSAPRATEWRGKFLECARRDYMQWRSSAFFKRYAEVQISPESIYLAPQQRDLILGRRSFERYTVPKAVSEFNPLLIIGEPGSGKTTALRQMTSLYLDEAGRHEDALLPLFVPVAPVATTSNDSSAVAEELIRSALSRLNPAWGESIGEFWKQVDRRAFLVLFDGLNEIPEKLIPSYCASLSAFHGKLGGVSPASRVVIASRIDNLARGIDAVRRMSRHIFEVQKLTEEDRLDEFVTAQLPDADSRQRFRHLLHESLTLRLMAQSPFLLTGLIASFERTGTLPPTRSALLRELAEMLLIGEDALSDDTLARRTLQHRVLGDLALALRKRGLGLGAPRTVVDSIVNESCERRLVEDPALRRFVGANYQTVIIDDLVKRRVLTQDWWFVDEKGETVPGVRFWLEVIQEYFAAAVVVESITILYDTAHPAAERKRHRRELMRYVGSADWHQVLSIAIGLAPKVPAQQAFRDVCKASPLVAGLCVAGGHIAGERLLLQSVDRSIRRTIRLTAVCTGLNSLVAVAIAGLALWGAQKMYGGGWPVGGIELADVLPLLLRFGFILIACGLPLMMTFLEKIEDRLLTGLLPDRYVQPLLRALISTGTEGAVIALSRLERDFQGDRTVPKTVRFYLRQANRVWRFQTEATGTLMQMLNDAHQADYAIDRLEQIADVAAIPALLQAARRLPPSMGASAVRAAVRLGQASEAPNREELIVQLQRMQEDAVLHWRVRLAAFRGRRALGEFTAGVPWFFYLEKLTPRPRSALIGTVIIGASMVGAYFALQLRGGPPGGAQRATVLTERALAAPPGEVAGVSPDAGVR